MDTTVDEVAPAVYRLSTWIPGITEQGFTFNQFLLAGDQPFMFNGHQDLRLCRASVGGNGRSVLNCG